MRPGTYAAVVLPSVAVYLATCYLLGPDSRVTRELGFGLLCGSQALMSYGTYRLIRGSE